jgi:C4-dicarboxylate-specific signal transduction histidine kinase
MNAGEAMNGVGRVLTRVDVEGAVGASRTRARDLEGAPRARLEPFLTTKSAGTGLGLAHVRRVAEARWQPRASSEARGACFRVDLHLVV